MTAFERETLRYLGNAEADERLMALIASVEAELRKDVRPRGVYRRLPIAVSEGRVEAGGHVFESSALAKNLCGCGEAFFLAATLGAEADRRLRRFSALDLPRAAVWQAGCAAYLEEYIDGMEDGLRREAPGLYLRPRFRPRVRRSGYIAPAGDVCSAGTGKAAGPFADANAYDAAGKVRHRHRRPCRTYPARTWAAAPPAQRPIAPTGG